MAVNPLGFLVRTALRAPELGHGWVLLFQAAVISHHSCPPTGDKFQSVEGLTGWGSIVNWSLLQIAFSNRVTTTGLGQEQPRCRGEEGMEATGRGVDVQSGASFGASI